MPETLQLGKTTGKQQHHSRQRPMIFQSNQRSCIKNPGGRTVKAQHFLNFGGISQQALKMKTHKITDVKLWAECSHMYFTWFSAELYSSHFPSQTQLIFCPIYMVCLHIRPWLEHRSCCASTLLFWSLSALSIRTISLKCFGNAQFSFFSDTETIQQEDNSLVPLCSMCLWHNTQGATH